MNPGDVFFDDRLYFETYLWIKDKHQRIAPFIPNRMQAHFLAHRTGRDLILKARQLGCSTAIQGRLFRKTVTIPATTTVTISSEPDNTAHLRDIFKLFYSRLPEADRPRSGYDNVRGVTFPGLLSTYYIGTAGKRTFGRGDTITNVHGSEVAFWPHADKLVAGLEEAVPDDPGTDIVYESTPNGAAGRFYEMCMAAMRGEGKWAFHFYPWWWDAEYRIPLEEGESLEPYNDEELALIAQYGLTPAQIKWRRGKLAGRGQLFYQEYPEDPVTCFLLSGTARFDRVRLKARLAQCTEPIEAAYPLQLADGRTMYQLRIYKKPVAGWEYVIGADTAEGVGGDYCAATVRCKRTGEQVATLHGQWPPDLFAERLAELGRRYNNALIGVERNKDGVAVLLALVRVYGYQNLYIHNDGRLGWPTTTVTRPLVISDYDRELRGTEYIIHDRAIIDECLTFVINDRGKPEAATGAHDDLVIADAIAGQMRWGRPAKEVVEVVYSPIRIGNY